MSNRVIFVNRFFHPDHSATSQILTDLALSLSRRGGDVCVIACRQLYDNPAARLPAYEVVDGVRVHRVATTRFGRFALLGRAIDLISFYAAACLALYRTARRGDIVVAMTDPPLLSVAAALIARVRGFKLVNWIQDLYPEIAVCLGMHWLNGAIGRVLADWRNWSLGCSAMNVVIGNGMADRLRSVGIADSQIATISNWADDESVVPETSGALRSSWLLDDKFVVAYSGNLGRAHDIDAFLKAAELLRDRKDIEFVFIGGGQALKRLSAQLQERGISNVRFRPYQPREMLSQSLAVADLHWLSLSPSLDGLIVPSKFYGIAAAGRPMIVVSSPNMELALLVSQWDCGVPIVAGDGVAFAQAVEELARDSERCRRMGENARRMLDAHFTKAASLEKWHGLLAAIRSATGSLPAHDRIAASAQTSRQILL